MFNYIQLPLEIFSFISLAFLTMKIKEKYPNLLFPPHNVEVFLPPTQTEIQEMMQKTGRREALQVKIMKSLAPQFTTAPFSNELELTVMFILMLVAQFTLVETFKAVSFTCFGIVAYDSQLLYYFELILLFILIGVYFCLQPYFLYIGNIFKAATMGGLQSQESKMAAIVSGLCTVAVLVVFFGLREHVGINIRQEFQRQQVHLEIVLYEVLDGLSFVRLADIFTVLLALLVSCIMFCFVPVLIRFVNLWTDVREEVQNSDEFTDLIKSEESTKTIFYKLSAQVIIMIPILAMNINSFSTLVTQPQVIQTLLATLLCILQCSTYKYELNRHMYKAFVWIKLLVDQPELFPRIQSRVIALYRGMLLVSYQLLARIVLPMLLLLIMQQKENTHQTAYQTQDFYCQQNQISTMDVMRGWETCVQQDYQGDVPKLIIRRIQIYGLISKSLVYTLVQFFYFNFMMLQLLLTVSYIFFLNKTKTVSSSQTVSQSIQDKQKKKVPSSDKKKKKI